MQSFVFGGEEYERLEIVVQGYERAATGEFYDDNWLSVVVSVHCGGFRGRFTAAFLTSELESFHGKLASLYETLTGEAQFQTLEEQLSLTLKCDGRGQLQLQGEALDQLGVGNRLSFKILIDQTQLESSVRSLASTLRAYPVRT